jgi:hypothetical protein
MEKHSVRRNTLEQWCELSEMVQDLQKTVTNSGLPKYKWPFMNELSLTFPLRPSEPRAIKVELSGPNAVRILRALRDVLLQIDQDS